MILNQTNMLYHHMVNHHRANFMFRPANERRRYKVTQSLNGWAQTYNQPYTRHSRPHYRPLLFNYKGYVEFHKHVTTQYQAAEPMFSIRIYSNRPYKVCACFLRGPKWCEWCIVRALTWCLPQSSFVTLQWRHNECDFVSNHQPHDCLLNYLFKVQIKENIKAPRHWPLWGEFTGDRWIPRTKGQ